MKRLYFFLLDPHSKHKSQSNVVPTRCTRAMSHSPGRKQAADQEASRVYCVADEEEVCVRACMRACVSVCALLV